MSVRKRAWVTRHGEAREAWIVDYVDQEGDRHIQTFDRKKDADAYHDNVRVGVRQGIHTAPSKSPTVLEAGEAWIKRGEADGLEATTIRQYRQHLDLHIAPRIGREKLADLTPGRMDAVRDDLLEKLSRPMARKVLTSLKSLLRASKHVHVAADVSIKRRKRDDHKLEEGRDFPTPAEIKRLIDATEDSKRRALLLTTCLTGLRASELRGLRWSDVKLNHGELHVRQRADRFNRIGPPKSAASRRTIPLDADVLIPALKKWKLACPKGEADLVFPTAAGKVEHHKNMLLSLEPGMKAAGVVDKAGDPKYGLHALRHFFASWCINRKADGGRELPAKVVQSLLGHSSIVMTLDRYGHLFPRGDDRAELAASSGALLA